MKHLKKLAGVLLALVMVMALAAPAFALNAPATPMPTRDPDGNTNSGDSTAVKGTITVKDAEANQTYTLYKIFDLESYNTTTGAYTYTINGDSPWYDFIRQNATAYFTLTPYSGKTGVYTVEATATNTSAETAQAFAKLALEHAKTNSEIKAVKTQTTGGTKADFVWNDLALGYYLVNSTTGTLCSLTTTNSKVIVYDKNELPTVEKEVQTGTDANGNPTWDESNTAQIGDTVNFRTTVHAKVGAQNYVLHDKMTEGLTFDVDSVKVKVGTTELTNTDYTVTTGAADGCTFHVTFTSDYLNGLTADTDIVVSYSATLNANAAISGDTNDNTTHLDYGEDSSTEEDKTTTTVYRFDLVKTDSDGKLLDGAKFKLYDAETGGNEIALVLVEETNGIYRVATEAERNASGFESAVIEAGKVTIKGLKGHTSYWLEEIDPPHGYNKLDGRTRVEIEDENKNVVKDENSDVYPNDSTQTGVVVVNKTGSVLPSTGGIGTTLFYVVGGVLVLGAVVLLITKRRASVDDE